MSGRCIAIERLEEDNRKEDNKKSIDRGGIVDTGWVGGERERERDFKARIGEEGNLYNGEVGNISDQWSDDSHNRTQVTELEFYLGNRVEFDY